MGGTGEDIQSNFSICQNSLVKLPELLTWFKKRERERKGLVWNTNYKRKRMLLSTFIQRFFFKCLLVMISV